MSGKLQSLEKKIENFVYKYPRIATYALASPFIVAGLIDGSIKMYDYKSWNLPYTDNPFLGTALIMNLFFYNLLKPVIPMIASFAAGEALNRYLRKKELKKNRISFKEQKSKISLYRKIRAGFKVSDGNLVYKKSPAEAIIRYKQALAYNPTDSVAYYDLFENCSKLGKYKEGFEFGRKAIEFSLTKGNFAPTPFEMNQTVKELKSLDQSNVINRLRLSMAKTYAYITGCANEKSDAIKVGKTSLVLLGQNETWKFSDEIEREKELLDRIKHAKNVIIKKNYMKEYSALELEFIRGASLENILEYSSDICADKCLKYSSDIMNGLVEMRKAGIYYHRDIRPANIVIDEENDRAIIIDLGIATTDKRPSQYTNRRYGGVNDLVSLGQVMYTMATGKHLFANSESMTKTFSDVADLINDERTNAYRNPGLLSDYLKKVDDNVQDDKIKTLIKSCLTAKNYDYGKIQKIFERLK